MLKIVIAVGGTGGHIFPAMALIEKLQDDFALELVGSGIQENTYLQDCDLPVHNVTSSALPFSKPWKWPHALLRIGKGVNEAEFYLKDTSPDLIIGFGSYHTLPVLGAAKRLGTPFVLYESNAFPGKINRLFSSSALWTAITFPEAKKHLRGETVVVEMPIRCKERVPNSKAYYGLDESRPTVLVFGGSQGADQLNLKIPKIITSNFQVLHFTGSNTTAVEALYRSRRIKAVVKSFEPSMEYAWSAADYVIGRAGAATIHEAVAFEVPGLFIPYPFATDQHQDYNALFMENEIRGGLRVREEDISILQFTQLVAETPLFLDNIQSYNHRNQATGLDQLIQQTLVQA